MLTVYVIIVLRVLGLIVVCWSASELLILNHDVQHVLVLRNFRRLSISRLLLPQLRLSLLLLYLPSLCHLGVVEIN